MIGVRFDNSAECRCATKRKSVGYNIALSAFERYLWKKLCMAVRG
jgi:hypothetical protein